LSRKDKGKGIDYQSVGGAYLSKRRLRKNGKNANGKKYQQHKAKVDDFHGEK